MEAIALRLEAIATRVEAIALRLEAMRRRDVLGQWPQADQEAHEHLKDQRLEQAFDEAILKGQKVMTLP